MTGFSPSMKTKSFTNFCIITSKHISLSFSGFNATLIYLHLRVRLTLWYISICRKYVPIKILLKKLIDIYTYMRFYIACL